MRAQNFTSALKFKNWWFSALNLVILNHTFLSRKKFTDKFLTTKNLGWAIDVMGVEPIPNADFVAQRIGAQLRKSH